MLGNDRGFNPLWINTTLKLVDSIHICPHCFNPLWINTTLKQSACHRVRYYSFNPLWINTTLKLFVYVFDNKSVSIPYGLTLLSNELKIALIAVVVSIPYGLTLLSNRRLAPAGD